MKQLNYTQYFVHKFGRSQPHKVLSLHSSGSSHDSDCNLTPLVITKPNPTSANKLRRNSISLPALNNVDLEALQQAHINQITPIVSKLLTACVKTVISNLCLKESSCRK